MADAPNSYKDPYWSQLASAAETKVGIPDGLLAGIMTRGERSNADQVSEAGARTPFQITPPTRKAAIDKYGIDPYLSPENAAEVAALLLKDSMDRNGGSVTAAVGEYHGGTDRSNWGPKTKAYIARVVNGMQQPQSPISIAGSGDSTFQRALARQQQSGGNPGAIAAVYDAYRSGKMSPQEAQEFEQDVKNGVVMAPRGATLNDQTPPAGPNAKPEPMTLPPAVTEAYVSGKMSEEERAELESDMRAGLVKLPPSTVSQIPTDDPNWKPPTEQGVIERPKQPTLGEKLVGAGEAALTTATGATGGAVGMLAGEAKGITQSILDGSFGTQQAADMVEQQAMKGAQALTYQPRTATGQEYAAKVGEAAQQLVPVAPLSAEAQLLAAGTRTAAPAVEAAARAVGAPLARAAEATASGVKSAAQTVAGMPGRAAEAITGRRASVGAAAVPEDAVRAAKSQNLPVPVDLTRGAETRDAAQLAFEKEQMKGALGAPLRERAEKNNLQALQNFETLIDSTEAQTPDLASTGNSVTKALAEGYKAAKNKTNVAYAVARKSPEALIEIDPAAQVSIGEGEQALTSSPIDYLNSKPSGLKTTALTDHAKQYAIKLGVAEMGEDGSLIPRKTDVRTMEDWRKEISQATGYDPAEIRDSTILKKLIDAQTEPVAGPLYQQARALRTAQARKYENRAIVARLVNDRKGMDDPMVAADQVFNRSILNSSPDEVTFLKRVLNTTGTNGRQAWKDLQGSTMRYIRDEATKGMGMDSSDNPIVSPAKLHQVVTTLDKNGKLDLVLGKQNAQIVRDLNDVVRYVNTVPPGTLVNNSGTVGTLLAAMAEAGTTGAITGLPLPTISILRALSKKIADAKMRAKIENALNAKQPRRGGKF